MVVWFRDQGGQRLTSPPRDRELKPRRIRKPRLVVSSLFFGRRDWGLSVVLGGHNLRK